MLSARIFLRPNGLGWGFDGMDGAILALVALLLMKEFAIDQHGSDEESHISFYSPERARKDLDAISV